MENELYHWGVRGMRWGVRQARYKNYRKSGMDKATARNKVSVDGLKDKRKIINETYGIVKNTRDIVNNIPSRSNKKNTVNIKKMTDEDLRNRVKRLNLEQQYSNLSSTNKVSGKQKVDTILGYSGTALAIASSAVAIAIGIKELKG